MKPLTRLFTILVLLAGALASSGCLVVSDSQTATQCYDDCYDYEVCETYCDAWSCWDECWWETSCTTYCEETLVEDTVTEPVHTEECYSDVDCGEGTICVADRCQPRDTEERGLGGLCQSCETNADCMEEGALCIRLNFDQATTTGEKVCTRTCEYNHDCPSGFECINVSSEAGTPAQCLPMKTEFEKRTCNPSPELECVRATDCAVGESCVNNACVAPDSAECGTNRPCASGQVCRNQACVADDAPECVDRNDCSSGELCIDGSCEASAEGCVFNEECDDGMCVDGQCLSSCSTDANCAAGEHCREGLCEPLSCRRSADCSAGEICVDAQCETTCQSDSHCGTGTGYVCDTAYGYCKPDPSVECRSNAECAQSEICGEGSCVTPCSCNQQCASGEVCDLDSGTCEAPATTPAPECENDCDCPSGLSCNANGQCG